MLLAADGQSAATQVLILFKERNVIVYGHFDGPMKI